jgi:hypothetical protein
MNSLYQLLFNRNGYACSLPHSHHIRAVLGGLNGNPETDLLPKNQTQPDLRLGELCLGTEFRWKTFGVTIDSTVPEFARRV